MRQLQRQTKESIAQLGLVGDVENLVDNRCAAIAVPDGAAAGLDNQEYNDDIPYHLGKKESKKLVGLKVIQSFRIQQRFQYIKVIEEYEQKRDGDNSKQRVCEILLDSLTYVAQQVVYVGHLLERILGILAYDRCNTVPLHWRAYQIAQAMRITLMIHYGVHWG